MNALSFIYYFRFFIIAAAIITVIANNSQTVAAAGFGVSPSTLDFTVEEGSESSRQLIIYNTGKESEFSIESSSPEVVRASPSSGILPEEGTAVATVTALGKKVGTSESKLAISFGSHARNEVSVALGTIVAVKLSVVKGPALSASAFVGMLLSTFIVLFGASAYCASRKKIRQLIFARA